MAHREMTDNERHLACRKQRPVALSREEQQTDAAQKIWLHAVRFRRFANRALKAHRMTFTQWRVLDAMDRLEREFECSIGQTEIARRCEADEGTVSRSLRKLRRAGLVNIEPEFWGLLNGVLMTDKGRTLLASTRIGVIHAARLTLP